jgi:PPM family protein phosphatase
LIMTFKSITSPVALYESVMDEPAGYTMESGITLMYSTRAFNKESANEDALAVIPINESTLVLAIADGLGGMPAGEQASRTVIQTLVKSLVRINQEDISVREVLLNSIEKANDEILELKNGAASTLVVAEVSGKSLRTYHAGDSMIMLMGNRGKIKYSAIPHSPLGYALESGIINESEAMLHKERHLISNYIGSPDMRLEMGPSIEIDPRDTLLLASDGLSDNLYDSEIVELCRKGAILDCSRNLISECNKYMTQAATDRICRPDDLSFIIFRLTN